MRFIFSFIRDPAPDQIAVLSSIGCSRTGIREFTSLDYARTLCIPSTVSMALRDLGCSNPPLSSSSRGLVFTIS